jgi:NAD(P)H-dependent FMN reductase
MKLQIITGSVRAEALGTTVAKWAMETINGVENLDVELLDLRTFDLPLSLEQNTDTARWNEKLSEADAYMLITPEYNHGYPAALKNALDHSKAWDGKPVFLIGYSVGPAAGIRAVEQLRPVVSELGMVQLKYALQIPSAQETLTKDSALKQQLKESLVRSIGDLRELASKLSR